ncbi:hypothetical protein D9M68_791580 [compost metagenome]
MGGTLGTKRLASQQQQAGHWFTHSPEQALGASGPRHDADTYFGLTEASRSVRDDQVAHHCQLATGPQGNAANRSNKRFLATNQRSPILAKVQFGYVLRALGHQQVEIRSRSEHLVAAADDDHGHRFIALQLIQGTGNRSAHRQIQRIAFLFTVKAQDRHSALALHIYRITHRDSPADGGSEARVSH